MTGAESMVSPDHEAGLRYAYAAFNARDIDAALRLMRADVEWPNGMEGGSVRGHDEVRAYWTRQWGLIDPHVEPLELSAERGALVAEVRQVLRDLAGAVLADRIVHHVYAFDDAGLVRRMDIRA